ncbi:Hsp70 family protein [Streptomyces sp. NPDC050546]|uniref:Hsp70 family protein n=1 Tax=Streptomyces sp. NPDC050546 TaxID=3365628 RepID=UPI0037A2E78D
MSPSENPAEAILVVDFGTTTTQAALVEGDSIRVLHEPATGAVSWPSSVLADGAGGLLVGSVAERGKRLRPTRYRSEIKRDLGSSVPLLIDGTPHQPEDLVSAALRAVAAEARRVLGRSPRHVLLTVPAAYGPADPRRDAMIRAAAGAGLDRAELLVEPVAAAYSLPVGAPFAAGDVILVHDFGGGTFDAAVVRIGTGRHGAPHEVLGHASLEDCGGRDLDAALLRHLAERHSGLSGVPGDADEITALRGGIATGDFVRELKHDLSTAGQVEDLSPGGDVVLLERAVLDSMAEGLIGRTVECCRDLLTKADVRPEGLAAVLMAGGSSRSPVVREHLEGALGIAVRHVENPQLAVVRGAASWASGAPSRDLRPTVRPPGTEPLTWTVPGGSGIFLGPVVAEGRAYEAGAVVADVRSVEGTLHRLRAERRGEIRRWHAEPGERFVSGDWLVTTSEAAPDTQGPLRRAAVDSVRAIGWTREGALRLALPHGVKEWPEGGREQRVATARLPEGEARFEPGGEALVVADPDSRTAFLLALDGGRAGRERQVGLVPPGCAQGVRVVQALPVGPDRLVVAVTQNPDAPKPSVSLWTIDTTRGDGRHVLNLTARKAAVPERLLMGWCSGRHDVVWASKQAAVALVAFDEGAGHVVGERPLALRRNLRMAAVHPDGPVAVTHSLVHGRSSTTATIRVGEAELTTTTPTTLEFSPDGRTLAIALRTGWCLIVDSSSCARVTELAHSPAPITHLAWSHDGTRLALAGGGKVSVWDGELFRP